MNEYKHNNQTSMKYASNTNMNQSNQRQIGRKFVFTEDTIKKSRAYLKICETADAEDRTGESASPLLKRAVAVDALISLGMNSTTPTTTAATAETTTIAPRRMEYANIQFRSTLEARFAVLLDSIGIRWLYESVKFSLNDTGRTYTPDFYLPSQGICVELKPEFPSDDEFRRCLELSQRFAFHVVLMYGSKFALPFVSENATGPRSYDHADSIRGIGWKDGSQVPGFYAFTENGTLDVVQAGMDTTQFRATRIQEALQIASSSFRK